MGCKSSRKSEQCRQGLSPKRTSLGPHSSQDVPPEPVYACDTTPGRGCRSGLCPVRCLERLAAQKRSQLLEPSHRTSLMAEALVGSRHPKVVNLLKDAL